MVGLFPRALLAVLLLPGIVGFLVPWLVVRGSAFHAPGLLALLPGTALLLWCVWSFYRAGRGTLAPWDAPRHLVMSGAYRVSRNPMYVGVILVLWGWALGFQSQSLAIYAAIMMVVFHLRVVFFEEPWLAQTHGQRWTDYRARVPRWFNLLVVAALVVCALAWAAATQLPVLGAGGLLHPARRGVSVGPPMGCQNRTFAGEGVELAGWECRTSAARRGTLVYLHGIADNRTSSAGVIERFTRRGFDVIAYDSRAHGESGGDACTYGFYETRDLQRVIDAVGRGPIVLVGTSLGAAVALQQAARDPRISAIVAAETFSDLRTVATERAPFVFTSALIRQSFELAEAQGRFRVDEASPVDAASRIKVPVLLLHGAIDTDTPPDHTRRVYAALAGPKRMILVEGAGHNQSLRSDVWSDIEAWVDEVLGGQGLL